MRTMITLAAAVLTCMSSAFSQARPDFSGTWKLNIAKSNFGALPAPESSSLKVEHRDPALKMVSTTVSSSGERAYELSFTTDGKECTNWVGNVEVKSVLRWDGATLIMEHKAAGGEVTLRDQWALSEDGKILTVTRHWSGSQGETTQTLVHEKQ
ncbi:MAG: hypothetical protein RMI94_10475 [Bryobacterales bacterium]|nr:hypothetical protein [Bryobacteraceae bacterium]MDW8130964.1 hypothetical protein [Bryobacterales bacterium]